MTPSPAAPARRAGGRRVVVTLLAGAVLTVAGAYGGPAAAYWSTAGTGTGVAVAADAPTITAVTTAASGLYPGGTTTLPVTVTNPGDAPLTLSTVTPGTVTSGTAGCATSVSAVAPATLPTLPAHGSATVDVAVTMATTAPNTCQGAAFSVPVALTATL